ncbi:transcriptional regulator, TetR family [Streptomyces noursei ATCC 11455]|uniref:hypothetical protein n=1 Tax=Streptomyces noursei TaxID=1971 RepID=UPI00081CD1B9|nr:transcriptional regulator, TetR family [Streptomyces noursei ATCC 11455]
MSVGDKDALLVAIFDSWIDAVHRARTDDQDKPPAVPPSAGTKAITAASTAADTAMALFEPFIRHFALDEDLSREYAAIIVRGAHESAIFQNLALSLIAEITEVLARAGLDDADAGRGARVVYFSYLGILMTVLHGTFRESDALNELREAIGFVLAHEGEKE